MAACGRCWPSPCRQVSRACETVLIFTDRLFLSRLGSVPMSAAMAGGLTSFMLMTFFIGLTGYATALVAQYLGAAGRVTASWSSPVRSSSFLATPDPAARPLAHDLFAVMDIPAQQLVQQKLYFDILLYGAILVSAELPQQLFLRHRPDPGGDVLRPDGDAGQRRCQLRADLRLPALGIRGAAYGTPSAACAGCWRCWPPSGANQSQGSSEWLCHATMAR